MIARFPEGAGKAGAVLAEADHRQGSPGGTGPVDEEVPGGGDGLPRLR